MITNDTLDFGGKLPAAVDLRFVAPGSGLESQFQSYFTTADPIARAQLQLQLEQALAGEAAQLEAFTDVLLAHFSPGYKATEAGSYVTPPDFSTRSSSKGGYQQRLVVDNPQMPFVGITTRVKDLASLEGKVRRYLLRTADTERVLVDSGKIFAPGTYDGEMKVETIRDTLGVSIEVPEANVAAIDTVVQGLQQMRPTAEQMGMKYWFPGLGFVKDYRVKPKANGYGTWGAVHVPVYFVNPASGELRMIEVQVRTQEQVFRAANDEYHAGLKPALGEQVPLYLLMEGKAPERSVQPRLSLV